MSWNSPSTPFSINPVQLLELVIITVELPCDSTVTAKVHFKGCVRSFMIFKQSCGGNADDDFRAVIVHFVHTHSCPFLNPLPRTSNLKVRWLYLCLTTLPPPPPFNRPVLTL